MTRRGEEVVRHVGIVGLGHEVPITRRDRRRMRLVGSVPGLRSYLSWLNCSVPLTRGRLDGWMGPVHRHMKDLGNASA